MTWTARPPVGLAVDLVEEVTEVHGPVLRGQFRDHLAGCGVQGREQVNGAVPHIVETPPPRHSRDHRQHRRGPLKGLDPRFLVHREHHRVRRRGEIETDDVTDLVDQERVWRDPEGLGPPRLQAKGVPDPQHTRRRDPHDLGQLPLRPVGPARRCLLKRADHDFFHLGIGDGPRHPGPWLVRQAAESACRNRVRHLATVLRSIPNRAATAVLFHPRAHASTI